MLPNQPPTSTPSGPIQLAKSHWQLLHPLLLAAAPVIYLYTKNYQESEGRFVLLFVALALAATLLLLGLVRLLVVRDLPRATLIVSVCLLLFYTYGHAFQSLVNHWPRVSFRVWHWLLLSISAAALGAAIMFLRRTRRDLIPLGRFVTLAATVFVLFSVGRIVKQEIRCRLSGNEALIAQLLEPLQAYQPAPPLAAETPDRPDVYYIILDAYARDDVLNWLHQYDNSHFLDELRKRGFYVADQSCSNYPYTFLSLASSTNMRYLDDLTVERDAYKPQVRTICQLVRNPLVARIFQSKGYRFVHLRTNFFPTAHSDLADIEYGLRPEWLQSEFSQVLLQSTMLRLLEPSVADQHLHAFRTLMDIPKIEGPTFTFAHLLCPHNPFVFDRNGKTIRDVPQMMQVCDKGYIREVGVEYPEQIMFVNKKMLEVIDHILATSKTPPIIIVQGDHGSAVSAPVQEITPQALDRFALERMPIFNVYLVPEKMRSKLYPTISPVNTFRLLLSECFGEHFEPLPDRHRVGWYTDVFNLRDVTEVVHDPSEYQRALAARLLPQNPTRK